jgi:hypothetical protein
MADPQQVASAFCNHFYSTFTQHVEGLAGLYVSGGLGGRRCTRWKNRAGRPD